MSAPLRFDVPDGYADFVPTAPRLGWRLVGVRADAVRAGHFTQFNGFRQVLSVAEGWVTEGRGKKRHTYLATVSFERADGTFDVLKPDDELPLVYAP
jgi:hypothetical protein